MKADSYPAQAAQAAQQYGSFYPVPPPRSAPGPTPGSGAAGPQLQAMQTHHLGPGTQHPCSTRYGDSAQLPGSELASHSLRVGGASKARRSVDSEGACRVAACRYSPALLAGLAEGSHGSHGSHQDAADSHRSAFFDLSAHCFR